MPATYEPIATTTLGSAAASIVFSSISSAYTDLRIVLTCTTSTAGGQPAIRFNGDTGTNYSNTRIEGNGSSATSNRNTNSTYVFVGSGESTTIPSLIAFDIFSYAGSTNKSLLISYNSDRNGSGEVNRYVGLWRNTAAITSITLLPNIYNFNTGTTATLYGILRA